ncbi:MAG: peptidase dimerization domain-containing protein [Acidobacteriota bacterium]
MNVIPSEAEATIDVRVLPDENVPQFLEQMKKIVNDPAVKIEQISAGARTANPPLASRYRSVQGHRECRQASLSGLDHLAPPCLPAQPIWRSCAPKGIQSYGLGPRHRRAGRYQLRRA